MFTVKPQSKEKKKEMFKQEKQQSHNNVTLFRKEQKENYLESEIKKKLQEI